MRYKLPEYCPRCSSKSLVEDVKDDPRIFLNGSREAEYATKMSCTACGFKGTFHTVCGQWNRPGCWCFCRSRLALGITDENWLLLVRQGCHKALSQILKKNSCSIQLVNDEVVLVLQGPRLWFGRAVKWVYYLPFHLYGADITTYYMGLTTKELKQLRLFEYLLALPLRAFGRAALVSMSRWAVFGRSVSLTNQEKRAFILALRRRALERYGDERHAVRLKGLWLITRLGFLRL